MTPQQASAWPVRRTMIFGFLGVFALLGGVIAWIAFSSISGAVVASGQIEVDRNRQVVQHIDGGIVAEILVEEGDVVEVGQVLLRLDATDLISQLRITENQLFEMMARRGRLEAERDEADEIHFAPELLTLKDTRPDVADFVQGQLRLFQARRESVEREVAQLDKRASQIKDQILGIQAQQKATREQLDLIQEELNNQQALFDRGLAQASVVVNLERNQADLEGRLGELTASEAQARGRITELEIEALGLRTQRQETAIGQLRDMRYRERQLMENRRAMRDRLDRMDIVAPVSGVVYGLAVKTPRSVIRPAEPLLYLVPQDRPLVISAQVAPTDIDQIYVGQSVSVRLPALDQRRTPELFGTVTRVSADAFQDDASGRSFYRSEIQLDPGELERLPEGTSLVPGMPVSSFLKTADRSPLAYLIKPLTDYFARAFRES
uniref:Membrane fusion protein (MFP) family protein n=1 Tax=Ruegeria sp. PR1b TaxID=185588 RepID=Q8KWB3_9RHOB|nr:HlyD family type I secretion periplasmic adaptor subunit [Ruegeria sp. PR1b]AAN05150.1 RB129 [Ruegeria sp. PR1b]